MKVLKFGGSSVGSAQGLRQVRRIVAANDGQIVVVVSALGGITDRLLATAAAAAAGKPDYTDSLAEIVARHRTTIDETVASERRGAIRRRTVRRCSPIRRAPDWSRRPWRSPRR